MTITKGGACEDGITRAATFSDSMVWRYTLERYWSDKPHALFVLLNPSTADETYDDPTNRRGQSFARSWGMGGVVFVNLFAFRTKDPKEMKAAKNPIGPNNDWHIIQAARVAGKVIFAWGTHGTFMRRDLAVRSLFKRALPNMPIWHLGLTKDNHPKHPLYLKADTKLERWTLP